MDEANTRRRAGELGPWGAELGASWLVSGPVLAGLEVLHMPHIQDFCKLVMNLSCLKLALAGLFSPQNGQMPQIKALPHPFSVTTLGQ